MSMWPADVGILDLEVIVPAQYVDQTKLETFDGVTAGKYTVGLGQAKMGFCTDREDINSLCLTAVSALVSRAGIDYADIGRLDVGTETIVDKSKSVKTVLMQLFADSGNHNVEGIDTTNACYGGTAALFNALAWVESSAWDGRLAVVVAGDIAVYAAGSARPTGGAGAIAMLVGPQASLVVERGLRSTYMTHAYDFYKPDLASEYPVIDGRLSIQCYLSALDRCYQGYAKRDGAGFTLSSLDAMLFHSPYCKLVQKSVARLMLNDFVATPAAGVAEAYPGLERFVGVCLEETYFDRDVEQAFMAYSKATFEAKTKDSLFLANQVGNMYTPSLYGGLVSYLISKPVAELQGQRVGMFSYGSGLASSMYSLRVTQDAEKLAGLVQGLSTIRRVLDARREVPPEEFAALMETRERNHLRAPYTPEGPVEWLFPGTWYLERIDAERRRSYIKSDSDL